MPRKPITTGLRRALPISLLIYATAADAVAQVASSSPGDIGTANVAGTGSSAAGTADSATAAAPSRTPLDVTQPTSLVGPNYIQQNLLPTANYDEAIKFTPSAQNINPTGAGLQQNFQETIRGFQYTQFNTVVDGIVLPGSPTNFAPQSAAYFQAHDIGSVEVDRGPGTASTIGFATFGGTVAINTRAPSDTLAFNPYGAYGSFASKLGGFEFDTGRLAQLGGLRGYVDVERETADGYLTGTAITRDNIFGKFELPVGDSTLITFVTNEDHSRTHTPYGATLAQIQVYGPNFALNSNPLSQNYTGYDVDVYTTDFNYINVKSDLIDGFKLDDTIYVDDYYKKGIRGVNVGGGTDLGGTTANLNGTFFVTGQRTTFVNGVPGYPNQTKFHDYGNVIRLSKETPYGQLRAGIWVDYQPLSSSRWSANLLLNNLVYTTSASGNPFQFDYRTSLTTVQPYIEWALTPIPNLVVIPGLKFTENVRLLDATLNSGSKKPAGDDQHYNAYQPSIEARYRVLPQLSVYGQIARGYLAPPINVLQTAATPTNLSPEATVNYQVGATYQTNRLSLSADLYYIDFTNRIGTSSVNGINTFSNQGGAIYKGAEVEGTVKIVPHVFGYANGSLNDGVYTQTPAGAPAPVQIALVPRTTAAVGPLFQGDRFFGSVLAKYVGPQYGLDVNANNGLANSAPIKGYTDVDLSAGATIPILNGRKILARLNVNNLFDDHSLINVTSTTSAGLPLYYTNPGRSFFFTLAATL